ncbi:MAG TPA: protein kinase [Vicinamibacteria bacterium]|nr:protein kinase [Vicinamibacteria bacterium]
MALQPGTKLGSYEIVSPIGAGGMGEVYRARDTKLGREVAIKTLPSAVANDSEKLSRFEREARLLAALNHPNVATLHGMEDSEGIHFLVMELIEGNTLSDRIVHGPVPLDEARPLLEQLMAGLEAAHEKGVIHRDLKPSNIKISPQGSLKILDFGLAKAFSTGDTPSRNLSQSPTLTRETVNSVIMGTAAYMSPEQARGKSVDKRSDIWAFGAVLYEMLSGHPAFEGDDASEILAAVIKSDPSWERLPDDLPPLWLIVIKRCLEKEPKERMRDIADVRLALHGAFDAAASPSGGVRTKTMMLPWAIAVVASLIAIVSLVPRAPAPRDVAPARFTIAIHGELPTRTGRLMVLSPDGQELVYVAVTERGDQLYRRSLNRLEAVPIPGTEGARGPFFSPDGQSIGFTGPDGQLKKVSLHGGLPETLCECRGEGAWSHDGTIVFNDPVTRGLMIASAGGIPEPLTRPEHGYHQHPSFLPDGETVLFTDERQLATASLSTGATKILTDGFFPLYVPTGHLVFARPGGALWAAPFDAHRLETTGEPIPVLQGIRIEAGSAVQFSFAETGTAVYIARDPGWVQRMLVRVDREGREESLNVPLLGYSAVQFSPDGTRIALAVEGPEKSEDIWVFDTAREHMLQLTFDARANLYPIWTPDGRELMYVSSRESQFVLFSRLADGTGPSQRVATFSNFNQRPWSITPDGRTILYYELRHDTGRDIGILSLERESLTRELLATESGETSPQISRDGNWLAYTSDEAGQNEIFVRPFPHVEEGKWRVSRGGGAQPVWAPDGRELFYMKGNSLMSVPIDTAPTFVASSPRVLFSGPYMQWHPGPLRGHTYDVAPDGRSFLMIRESTGDGTPSEFIVIQDWFDELQRLVPTR